MPTLLETAGGGPQRQPRYVPIFFDRAFTGLFTQRSILHDPADPVSAKYYGGRPDVLWTGRNIELTNRLTLQRRPGHVPFCNAPAVSGATYPTAPDYAFSFQLTDGTIKVIIDTGSSGSLAVTSVASSSGGTAVYSGTFPNGGSNAYKGLYFTVAGFVANPGNNGYYLCAASTTGTITLVNAKAVAEGPVTATAVTTGGVYVDNQDGTNTQLYGKPVGAEQTHFVSVAGVLYAGDGVDTWKYTPGNPKGLIWNWGITAPTDAPTVVIQPSGAGDPSWQANTVFSTMGLIIDAQGYVWSLVGVNADQSNTVNAVFGTAGNGQPDWNQAIAGITTETSSTLTWWNKGQLLPWAANTPYVAAHFAAGNSGNSFIYDAATDSIYAMYNGHAGETRYSHSVEPAWSGAPGSSYDEGGGGGCVWFYFGKFSDMKAWQASHGYSSFFVTGTNTTRVPSNVAIEPFILPPPTGTDAQSIYIQVPDVAGTSYSGYPPFPTSWASPSSQIGYQQSDGQLLWMGLGTETWAAGASYIQWYNNTTPFGCIYDGVNMQVCVTSGNAGLVSPGTQAVLSAAGNALGGNTTYTGVFSAALQAALTVNTQIFITGFSTAANNGQFLVVSCNATQLVINNANGASESSAAIAVYNPWGTAYGSQITDGSVVWQCVGPPVAWAANTIWHLPLNGFQPQQASQTYGGSQIDAGGFVQGVNISGTSAASTAPTWGVVNTYTPDDGTTLALTSVSVSGAVATYNGTVTGLSTNSIVTIRGFSNTGNNGTFKVASVGGSSFTCAATTQISEAVSPSAKASTGLLWYAQSAVTTNSLTWKTGYIYAYSFKARALDDYYSPLPYGGGATPPGITQTPNNMAAFKAPTGSMTEAISTASPNLIITGANAGAANILTGYGSTDPQVDTIVIWRTPDGGGPADMYELTEIAAPPSIDGNAQLWHFTDFLPDSATTVGGVSYPGLNNLIPAPIDDSNDPPDSSFLPMVYNFQRIWGADGEYVPFSGGPDVVTGNPNEAFAPADSLPFLAPVIRLVKTPQGLVTFLTNSIEVIAGGPLTSSFFSVTWAPGIGLLSYNALDVLAGEMYFFASDNQFRAMTPGLSVVNTGFPLGDQFANIPSSGVSDTTWSPALVYVASYQSGIDNCIMVADGSTGWYRQNPRQAPGFTQGPEPIWSPFATITGGCKMIQAVETSPGIKRLLVGGSTGGTQILERSLTTFTDNGTAYDAYFVMGAITLAHPGQLALLKFVEFDFSGTSLKPTISYLLNEVGPTAQNPTAAVTWVPFTTAPQFDPPSLYGKTLIPVSYSPNRYFFLSNASLARCRFIQIKVDYGSTSNGDELYTMTIFGRLMIET